MSVELLEIARLGLWVAVMVRVAGVAVSTAALPKKAWPLAVLVTEPASRSAWVTV